MTEIPNRTEIENILNMRVRNLSFYQEALMHKSGLKLYGVPRSNERLEFIGDAVLNMIITQYVFDKFPNENEGFLTKYRMKIVSGKTLTYFANNLKLSEYVRMNTKAIRQKWNTNDRILEDVLEALIGAIYLDMGLFHVKKFILDLIEKYLDEKEILNDDNYKDILMRYTQSNSYNLPKYVLTDKKVENNNRLFHVNVYINDVNTGNGVGSTKKEAEQKAAAMALKSLEVID